jgi:hypothetical protein
MIVGETRCSCASGLFVVAVMSDGTEHLADANGVATTDFAEWGNRVQARAKSLPLRDQLAMLTSLVNVRRLAYRSCVECDGKGWLFRLHRDEMGHVTSDVTTATI